MTRLLAILAAVLLGVGSAMAGPIRLGEPAPTLGDDVTWLKGDPVPQWEDGHVYVLDFWATWCGPCIQSMPHITELQEKYRDQDVHVLGVAIFGQPGMVPPSKFVAERGDIMGYAVAEEIGGRIGNRFMIPLGQYKLPTIMMIDRQGDLVWVGNPFLPSFEAVLEKVVAGEFNAADAKALAAAEERAQKLIEQANAQATRGDWESALTTLDEIIAIDPAQYRGFGVLKFQRLLLTLKRPDEGYAFGRQIAETIVKDDPGMLELMARFIMEAPGLDERDVDLAYMTASRAVELTNGENEGVLTTYAYVLAAKGKTEKAVEVIDKAYEIAKANNSQLLVEITEKRNGIYEQAREESLVVNR